MEQPQQARKRMFISLRVKLLIGFTLIFSLVFAAAYYWFYQFATDRAMGRIREDLANTLEAAAEGVDGDQLVALYQEAEPNADGFTDDPRYWESLQWLDTVHKVEPRAWPGTYIKGEGDKEIYFVTDLFAQYDPSKAAGFKEYCDPDPDICGDPSINLAALSGEPQIDLQPFNDQWGFWVSGYAPVRDSDGEIVAGIFVDFLADYVLEVQQAIRDQVFVAFAVTYTTLFVLVFLVSGGFTRPIIKLTRVAERIGEGDYEADLSSINRYRFPDEIDILADVFGIMVEKVRKREEKLKKEVSELRIEIDEVKRQKQVSEIVDTDFFQDLQKKARSMRQRRSVRDQSPPEQAEE